MFELIAQESQQGGNILTLLAPLGLMGVLFYFLLIRPQQRRQKAQRELLSSVDVGDEVVTVAGIYGTVTDIDDDLDQITVEIAPGIEIRMVRRAISQVVGDTEDDDFVDVTKDEDEDAEKAT